MALRERKHVIKSDLCKMSKDGETLVVHSASMVEALKLSGWKVEDPNYFEESDPLTSSNADKISKINSTGLYVPESTWEFPIDLDILESLTTDFSRNSRVAPLLKCEIEGPIGGITTYYFYELGTIQIRKKRGGWSEIYIKRFKGLFWDKDLLIRKKELQDAIFNDYIDRVHLEVEESSKTVPDAPATGQGQAVSELPGIVQAPVPYQEDLDMVKKLSLDGKHTIQQISLETSFSVSKVNRLRKMQNIKSRGKTKTTQT